MIKTEAIQIINKENARISINSPAETTPNGQSTITGNVNKRNRAFFDAGFLHRTIYVPYEILSIIPIYQLKRK